MRCRSQTIQLAYIILHAMEEKYYTHFLIVDGSQDGYTEFSGVVEVMRYSETEFEDNDVRCMLADNLDVEADDLTVLQWSRVH